MDGVAIAAALLLGALLLRATALGTAWGHQRGDGGDVVARRPTAWGHRGHGDGVSRTASHGGVGAKNLVPGGHRGHRGHGDITANNLVPWGHRGHHGHGDIVAVGMSWAGTASHGDTVAMGTSWPGALFYGDTMANYLVPWGHWGHRGHGDTTAKSTVL